MADVIGEAFVRVRPETTGFGASLFGSIVPLAKGLGIALSAALGAKVLFVDPIKKAAAFEQSLNVLQATVGATDAQMKKVSDTAIQLGADTRLPATSAKDAADAMLELGKGGFNVQQAMDAARGALTLSAAAQISNAEAAQQVADSLHAFQLPARDAIKVVDLFANAANQSTATLPQMAQALQQVGAGAHQLHVPITDTVAALTQLANAGIKGSDAGTTLKTFLQRLVPVTSSAKKAMADLGVQSFDQAGKFVGLSSVLGQLHGSLDKLSDKQRTAALQTIFGQDATRAAGVLARLTGKDFERLTASVSKQGAAQKLAAAQTKGFRGAMEAFRSTVDTLQIQFGLKLLPVLTTVLRFIASNLPAAFSALGSAIDAARGVIEPLVQQLVGGLVQGFTVLQPYLQTAVDLLLANLPAAIAAASSAFSTLIGWLRQAVRWFTQHRDVMIAVGAGLATLVAGFAALSIISTVIGLVRALQASFIALNVVLAANPIGIIIVAIAALVGALIYLYQNNERARSIIQAAWAAIQNAVAVAVAFITGTLVPFLVSAWATISSGVQTLVETALALWARFGNEITTVARTAWQLVGTIFRGALNLITQTITLIGDIIHGRWESVGRDLVTIANTAIRLVLSVFGQLVSAGGRLAIAAGLAILNGIRNHITQLPGVLARIAVFVVSAGATAAAAGLAAATKIGLGIVKGVISGLANLASSLASKLAEIPGVITTAAEAAYSAALSIGHRIASGAIAGIAGLAGIIKDAVARAIKEGLSKINPFSPVEHGAWLYIALPIIRGTVRGLAQLGPAMKKALSQQVKDALAQAKQNLFSLASDLSSRLGTFLDARLASSAIGKRLQSATGAIDAASLAARKGELRGIIAGTKSPLEQAQEKQRADQEAAREAALRATLADSKTEAGARLAAQDELNLLLAERQQRGIDSAKAIADAKLELERIAAQEAFDLEQKKVEEQKKGNERILADLTDMLNRGLISQKTYQQKVQELLKSEGVNYKTVGAELGLAFADGFQQSLVDLVKQAAAIFKALGISGPGKSGLGGNISDPIKELKAQIAEEKRQVLEDKKAVSAAKKTKDDKKDDARAKAALEKDEKFLKRLEAILSKLNAVTVVGQPGLTTAQILEILQAAAADAAR